jgi:hypothetical protein
MSEMFARRGTAGRRGGGGHGGAEGAALAWAAEFRFEATATDPSA